VALYRRKWKRKDGHIVTTLIWWMSYVVNGKQHCESTGTSNKRLAQRILNKRLPSFERWLLFLYTFCILL